MYPRILYARLRMVDALEKTGISRSFSSEINGILDMTYAYASCPEPASVCCLLVLCMHLQCSLIDTICMQVLAGQRRGDNAGHDDVRNGIPSPSYARI